jgi:hypothetical protein
MPNSSRNAVANAAWLPQAWAICAIDDGAPLTPASLRIAR